MGQKKRLHFGVLFSSIDNICQCKIWEGIVAFAEIKDINLTAFLGTYQFKEDDAVISHYETCFETIKNANLDGLILFSGFIAEDMGIDKFNSYIEKLPKNLPIVSVSFPLEGVPSVLADNEKGTFDVVEHLINNHSKNKIVFIKGPNGHPEAELRFLGFKKALQKNGIKFDKKYVLNGHFSKESGQKAVSELFDKQIEFDALVACDDETAIGAMEELDARKILVPTNVAVAGFDDDVESETHIPSLTTARQPFFEIGKFSANTLFKHISSKKVSEICLVSPEFIARQSCGCLEKSVLLSMSKSGISASESFIYPFVFSQLISYFSHNIPNTQIHSWATALVEKITEEKFTRTKFLHLFDEILVSYRYYSQDFAIWHGVIGILFEAVEHHKHEIANPDLVFSALSSASVLIHNIHSKESKCRELALNDKQWLIRKLTNKLVLTFDFDALGEELRKTLPEFSISTAIVGLYSQPIKSENSTADRTIDNIIGFDENKAIRIQPSNARKHISFADFSSIDEFDFERELRAMFFIPLFFNNEELGVVLLPYNDVNPIDIYETLRINISTAVKGAQLLEKVRTLSITDELTGLLNRRGFFQFSYARLPYLHRHKDMSSIVLFLDMDGLKNINDKFGHKEGDAAIAVCAKLLRKVLRDEDIVGRIGGDEFVVFSSVKKAEDSESVIKRIRKKFDEYNAQKNHKYLISCSVGAMVLPSNATREIFDSAIQSADDILYEEKKEKRRKGIARQ